MEKELEAALTALKKIVELQPAEPDPLPKDFNAYDYSGGNYDDAYWMGADRGELWGKYASSKIASEALKRIENGVIS